MKAFAASQDLLPIHESIVDLILKAEEDKEEGITFRL